MAQAEASTTLNGKGTVDLGDYFESVGLDPLRASPADVVLALLRINTEESLALASDIVGKPITVCPPAVPPWKPVPVKTQDRTPTKEAGIVIWVNENPCLPTTPAFQRFRQLRVGMTVDQLLRRGLSRRDLRVWAKKGFVALLEMR